MIRTSVLALALFVVGCAAPQQASHPDVAVVPEAAPQPLEALVDAEPEIQSMRVNIHTLDTSPGTVHVGEDGRVDLGELMMAAGWARGTTILVGPEVQERVSVDLLEDLGLLEGVIVVY